MNKVNIGIGGINRDVDDGISKDGLSAELINLRLDNQSLEPVGASVLLQQFPTGRKPVFIHKNSGYEHYITYDGTSLYFEYDREDGAFTAKGIKICDVTGLLKVESIGNMLVLLTDKDIRHVIYKEGTYTYIGLKPELPFFEFTRNLSTRTSSEDFESNYSYDEVGRNEEKKKQYQADALGTFSKLWDKIETEREEFYKVMFIRYGLRLSDGSVIMQSPVYVATNGFAGYISFRGTTINMSCKAIEQPYTITLEIEDAKGIQQWKDLVTSVDIFVAMRNPYAEDFPIARIPESGSYATTKLKRNENLSTLFETVDNFYLVQSLGLNDIVSGTSKPFKIPKEIINNLEQQERLPLDDFSHHTVTGTASYSYNGRLHIGNVRTKLFDGFEIGYYQSTIAEQAYIADYVLATVNAEQGVVTTKSPDKEKTWIRKLSPVLAYPDYRATQLYFLAGTSAKKVQLKKHPFLNLAYYQDPALAGIELSADELDPTLEPTEESYSVESNKIKVSGLNNPLSFPMAQTYTVSNGDVLGLCSATSALSTGQFGQFPLYVFCTDGIYALEVGSSDVVYSRAVPVSRDVCKNPASITSTDNAVLFATEESIMLLSGSEVANISSQVEGFLPTFLQSSPVINKIADIVGYSALLSTVEFRNYIQQAKIGYEYNNKEIIVSNKDYGYSYVFNMKSAAWHKISESVDTFLNSYPECFAYKPDGGVYNIYNPKRTVNNILLVTKPVKFGTLTHKRLLQTAIRGIVRPSLSDVYYRGEPVYYRDRQVDIFSNCGFYILGSNDAEHFTLVAGREKIEDVRDLITKMNKTKAYKYFCVCLAGGVRTDVSFNYIECLVDETYTNRLR